jgi:crotonobetainyl-CoA:carnitine CoA-transferase CaiB-like acyl-CoA transferase
MDCSTRFRAPLIGEHNGEIYKDLGYTLKDLQALKKESVV